MLLLVPTLLMGGALPMLVTWLQQHYGDASRRAARAYSVGAFGGGGSGAESADSEAGQGVLTVACYLVALAGAALMGLEVLTARAMGMLAGASQPSLWLVSAVFFFGIGLGATAVASPGLRPLSWRPVGREPSYPSTRTHRTSRSAWRQPRRRLRSAPTSCCVSTANRKLDYLRRIAEREAPFRTPSKL